MSNEVTVSIIMPVYGVEKYVGKAIESMQAQTFGDFEFLIVDDGTKDRSGIICDEYAAKDERIRVFHKENGGAPSARNLAIDEAKGKYFYFMDSDDWAEPTMLEDMVKLAEAHRAQLVVTGYFIDTYYSDTEYVTQEVFQPSQVFATQQEFRENAYRLFDHNLLYTPWNKLYDATYIRDNNLKFPQTFWDDFPFNLSVLRDVERVVVSDRKYYHFMRARAESETAKYRPDMYDKREEEHGWMVDLYRYWNIDDENSREFLARRYVERLIGCVENLTNPACTLSAAEKKAEIRRIISTDHAKEAAETAKPRSRYMKIMVSPIRRQNTGLTYWEGKCISSVKRKNVKLFATLKAGR
ncbi:MAG: glycosyltransferase family 2 protein [Clostridia bacterium]|nr:glycosyltransferase family 2 protein [Clostridia bacterium]